MDMEIKDYIYDRYNELESEKITGPKRFEIIRKEVKDKFDTILKSVDNLRRIVCDIKKIRENIQEYKGKINEIKSSLKSGTRYEVVGDEYVIHVKDKNLETTRIFRFTKKEIRDIFRYYSKHGGDKSGEDMIAKFCNGYTEVWNLIKSIFKVFKTSHIIDPDTLENSTDEELDSAMQEATNFHIDVKKEKLKAKYDETIKKEYFSALDKIAQGEYRLNTIDKFLQKYKPEDFELIKLPQCDNKKYLFGADHHCDGSEQGDRGFVTMVSDIVDMPEQRIVIVINGDDLETIVEAGMHPNQTNKMEKTGKNLVTHYISLWEWAIKEIRSSGKEVEVIFNVDSNHMRMEESNKKDKDKLAGWLFFQFLQVKLNILGAEVELLMEKTNSFRKDGFHWIVDHGHNGFNGKNPKEIVFEAGGSKEEWNIIISSHDHKLEQNSKNPGKNILWIKTPALSTKEGDFAKEHLLSSNPGYIIIGKDKRGNPRPETVFV